jgi:putative membrane protein
MKRITFAMVGLLATFAVTTGASAQSANEQDTTFLTKNQQSNLAEIATGNLAIEKGGESVKAMARQIVADHEKASEQNRAAAQAAGVTPPTEPNEMQKQQAATLQGLSGAAFDKAWIDIQVQGHRMAVADADAEITSGSNAQVKAFAEAYRPVAQGHLQMGTGGGGTAPATDDPGSIWLLAVGGAALVALAGYGMSRRQRTTG